MTEKPHLTPHCPDSVETRWGARDRFVFAGDDGRRRLLICLKSVGVGGKPLGKLKSSSLIYRQFYGCDVSGIRNRKIPCHNWISQPILRDMANSLKIVDFVIQITVLVRKLLQCPAGISGVKIMKVLVTYYLQENTS
jgi:hypothetical protein